MSRKTFSRNRSRPSRIYAAAGRYARSCLFTRKDRHRKCCQFINKRSHMTRSIYKISSRVHTIRAASERSRRRDRFCFFLIHRGPADPVEFTFYLAGRPFRRRLGSRRNFLGKSGPPRRYTERRRPRFYPGCCFPRNSVPGV